jgi:NAD(P)-dependent dehydrogenase (short-subunit alcohol dehydrogenase family)
MLEFSITRNFWALHFLYVMLHAFGNAPSEVTLPIMHPIKRILVTGANKGIGFALCKKLLTEYPETHVILCSRNINSGFAAAESILEDCPGAADKESTYASRIDVLRLDVSSDESARVAAQDIARKYGTSPPPLYAIVNNAAVGVGHDVESTFSTNYYGPMRVFDAFRSLLDPNAGRVVNVASALGPYYVTNLSEQDKKLFLSPDSTASDMDARIKEKMQRHWVEFNDAFGFSKACLIQYTMRIAKEHPNLKINSLSPGFIDTDAGQWATIPPEASCEVYLMCLFDENIGTGMYFGSDGLRSPLDKYRAPGDPEYVP